MGCRDIQGERDATTDCMTIADPTLPFWRSGVMTRESLCFIEASPGQAAVCALLLPPHGVVTMESASGEMVYDEGVDYVLERPSGIVTRTPSSRMPVTALAELRPSADPDGSGFMHLADDPATFLLTAEDDTFHRRQVAASYAFDRSRWTGYAPACAGIGLPRTLERLRRVEPLTIVLLGDSISEGYNASGFIGTPPYQPAYGTLVAAGLTRAYGSSIEFRNLAVAGWTSDHGLGMAAAAAIERPDLVMVAFGMNDAGFAAPADYAANIRGILAAIRDDAPLAEFVLIAPMLPNPAWHYPRLDRFDGYRRALAGLCGTGVILADLTTLWTDLLARKTPYDLTGNGVNHPNDFGHRLYAQTIVSLLIE